MPYIGNQPPLTVAQNSINSNQLINSAVTTTKIADSNVTNAKLGNSSVNANKLASNAVTTTKILDGSITTNKLSSSLQSFLNSLGYTG